MFRAAVFLLMALRPVDAAVSPRSHCGGPETLKGDMAFAEGRHAAAAQAYEAGLTSRQSTPTGADDGTIPCLMDRLATALSRMGKWKDAIS